VSSFVSEGEPLIQELTMGDRPIAHHVIMRSSDDRTVAVDTRELRRAARSLAERDPELGLVAFGGGGSHFHAIVVGTVEAVAEYARRVAISLNLALRPGSRFARYTVEPIRTRSHLIHALRYVWRQDDRHGRGIDRFREATNLPDLLGLRFLADFTIPRLRRLLPRWSRADILASLPDGKALDEKRPLRLTDMQDLPDAAAAVFALPSLRGNRPDAAVARAAGVQTALQHLTIGQTARLLGLSERTCRRLATKPVPRKVLAAVEGQLRIRAHARSEPRPLPEAASGSRR